MRLSPAIVARALAVLVAGFALADSAAGRALGDLVAAGLAAVAAPVLQALGADVLRTGTELRSAAGWAVRVSEVCDGHGLAISLIAGLVALGHGPREGAVRLLAGLAAIQLFNLARILTLALLLAQAPGAFGIAHTGVFPLLTVALLAFAVLPFGRALALLALALPLVLIWLAFADTLAYPFAAGANLLLSWIGAPEMGQIAERASGWGVGTRLLAGQDGEEVRLFVAPLRPADFALPLPLILAAVLMVRRPGGFVCAISSILIALVLGAFTAVWALAEAHSPATLLVPDGSGVFLAEDYTPPATARMLVRLAQNVLVHLNLLVLPFLIAGERRAHG